MEDSMRTASTAKSTGLDETFEQYTARQKAEFGSPEMVSYYTSRPATATYVRGSGKLQHHARREGQ